MATSSDYGTKSWTLGIEPVCVFCVEIGASQSQQGNRHGQARPGDGHEEDPQRLAARQCRLCPSKMIRIQRTRQALSRSRRCVDVGPFVKGCRRHGRSAGVRPAAVTRTARLGRLPRSYGCRVLFEGGYWRQGGLVLRRECWATWGCQAAAPICNVLKEQRRMEEVTRPIQCGGGAWGW